MLLIDMGALCEEAINYAVGALNEGSEKMRKLTYETDKHIDDREREIENLCLKLLLQQQPVARDLRQISSALKNDLRYGADRRPGRGYRRDHQVH